MEFLGRGSHEGWIGIGLQLGFSDVEAGVGVAGAGSFCSWSRGLLVTVRLIAASLKDHGWAVMIFCVLPRHLNNRGVL